MNNGGKELGGENSYFHEKITNFRVEAILLKIHNTSE